MLFQAGLRNIALVLLVLLLAASTPTVFSQNFQSRRIHVADGGLVFVFDTFTITGGGESVLLGIPSDMGSNLAGYYVVGEEASFLVSRDDRGVIWLRASPIGFWTNNRLTLVTVWKNLLVPLGEGRYQLTLPSNPIYEKPIESLELSVTIDGTPSITSISESGITIAGDKRSASGIISNIQPLQFKTLSVFFEAPDLLRYVVERAEVVVDVTSKKIKAEILVTNVGKATFSSIDIHVGKNSRVEKVVSGLLRMGSNFDVERGVLTVNLPYSLEENMKISVQIEYTNDDLVAVGENRLKISTPSYLNTTYHEYLLTVLTPPATDVSSDKEMWSLKSIGDNKKEVTFRFIDYFPTRGDTINIIFRPAPAAPYLPIALLLAAVLLAGFQGVALRRRPEKEETLPQLANLKNQLEKFVENALNIVESSGQLIEVRSFDRQLNEVKELLEKLRKSVKTPTYLTLLNSIEQYLTDLSTTYHALYRTAEDFRSGRLGKKVYSKVYEEYRKAFRKIADEIFNSFETTMKRL